MAYAATPSKLCQQCPAKDAEVAEMICLDCEIYLCMRCFIGHKNIPYLKNHRYVSIDASVTGKREKEDALEFLHGKDTNVDVRSGKFYEEKISKIIENKSGLERMLGQLHLNSKYRNVRRAQGRFMDILNRLHHVKTVAGVHSNPLKLGLINDHIWIRTSCSSVTVYNKDLARVRVITNNLLQWISPVLQVNDTEIIVGCANGLYLCNTNLDILYKIIQEGAFTDVTTDGGKVVAVDCTNQKVVYLVDRGNRWEEEHQFVIEGQETHGTISMQMVNNDLYICTHNLHRIKKFTSDSLVKEIGNWGSVLAEFKGPFICGQDEESGILICDWDNDRLQVLGSDGQCEQILIEGVKRPLDVLVLDQSVYVLQDFPGVGVRTVSKYCITM